MYRRITHIPEIVISPFRKPEYRDDSAGCHEQRVQIFHRCIYPGYADITEEFFQFVFKTDFPCLIEGAVKGDMLHQDILITVR